MTDKATQISERQANLPLPEQPPVASDWNSADARTVNVGSGSVSADFESGSGALREPATGDSAIRTDGDAYGVNTLGGDGARQGKDGLGGIPDDAVTKEAKGKNGTVRTTNEDKGYPRESDPSKGL